MSPSSSSISFCNDFIFSWIFLKIRNRILSNGRHSGIQRTFQDPRSPVIESASIRPAMIGQWTGSGPLMVIADLWDSRVLELSRALVFESDRIRFSYSIDSTQFYSIFLKIRWVFFGLKNLLTLYSDHFLIGILYL